MSIEKFEKYGTEEVYLVTHITDLANAGLITIQMTYNMFCNGTQSYDMHVAILTNGWARTA